MKTKLFFSVLVVFFVHGFGFGQSTFTSIKTGNWEDPTTWNYTNTGVNDEDGIPDSDDEVILTGDYTITVNGDSQCKSLLSQNSVLDILSGELSVNGKVEIKASNSKNITAVFRGLGRLICNSFDLGNLSEDTKTANYTTIVKSTISLLSIDGDLTIYSSSYDNTYTNNATFSLENGGVGLVGQIKTINENKGITTPTPNNLSRSTFTNEINLGRRTLVLVSSESLSLSEKGTNLIVLDGTNSEVNYSLIGPQNIIAVDYYDLNLYSPGVKTFPNSPINIKNILTLHRNRYEPEVDLGSNVTHTAGSLVLIGDRLYETAIEQLNGTYGGYTSSATNIIGNYFVNNTGIVKVGKPCTGPTKTWNGVSWSGGTSPISSDQIIFDGNYSSSGDLLGCNCTVNSGNVIFNTGNTLTLTNEVSVLGGTLTFENNSILIQKNAVTNTGIITYKHNSNELYKNDYMVWSSPVSGMIPRVLSPNTEENGFRLFNGDTWYFYDGTYGPGAGMAAAIMAPKTYSDTAPTVFPAEFKGIPNNGDIQVQSINAFLGNEDLKPWQLIGNPYPSALDLNAFFERNYNLPRVVYFWVNSSKPNTIQYKYKSADYACYNDTGRVSTDNDIVSDIQLLRPTQAFFVKSPTQSPIVFRNSMRVSGTISPFFKLSKKVDTEKSRLWLNLTNSEGLFKQILIGYVPIPDTSFNTSYNAIDFNNNKYADFYSAPNHDFPENRLVIQGILRPFTDTDEFPLGFMVNLEKQPAVASQFTISISHTDGDFDNQAVYLYDKINNSTNDLRKGGYTFSSVDGTFDDRFVIKFINNDLGVNDFDKTSKDLIVAVKNKT
ncbi:MAG TPA: hypothetical protein VLC96_07550, partial [Flavobacterium sp.]|nr:hypothetical protein [Flavobacterium sp.]